MAYNAIVYKVFITAPDDLPEEKKLIENSIIQWNNKYGEEKNSLLFPYYCETLEEFNPNHFDMVFGAYWTKLKNDNTGNFEKKILEFIKEGNPARFYFSNKDIPKSLLNINKWAELEKFKVELLNFGLVREFNDEKHLLEQLEEQITKTVENLAIMNKLFLEANDDPNKLEKLMVKKKNGFFNYIGTIEDTASELVHTIGDFIMQSSDFAVKLEEQSRRETGKVVGSFGSISVETSKLFTQFTKDIELSIRNYEYIWAEFSNIFSSFTDNVAFLEEDYLLEMKDLIEHLSEGLESAKISLVPFSGNFKSFGGSLDFNVSARILSSKLTNFLQLLENSLAGLHDFKQKLEFTNESF